LLDLFAARLEKRSVAVSSLCIAAAVPPTTALRWIKTLTDLGLLVRTADPQDGRRVYIELAPKAAEGVEACLKAALRVSPLII
jgi:DNA-binding MarR family transcriptional regulator